MLQAPPTLQELVSQGSSLQGGHFVGSLRNTFQAGGWAAVTFGGPSEPFYKPQFPHKKEDKLKVENEHFFLTKDGRRAADDMLGMNDVVAPRKANTIPEPVADGGTGRFKSKQDAGLRNALLDDWRHIGIEEIRHAMGGEDAAPVAPAAPVGAGPVAGGGAPFRAAADPIPVPVPVPPPAAPVFAAAPMPVPVELPAQLNPGAPVFIPGPVPGAFAAPQERRPGSAFDVSMGGRVLRPEERAQIYGAAAQARAMAPAAPVPPIPARAPAPPIPAQAPRSAEGVAARIPIPSAAAAPAAPAGSGAAASRGVDEPMNVSVMSAGGGLRDGFALPRMAPQNAPAEPVRLYSGVMRMNPRQVPAEPVRAAPEPARVVPPLEEQRRNRDDDSTSATEVNELRRLRGWEEHDVAVRDPKGVEGGERRHKSRLFRHEDRVKATREQARDQRRTIPSGGGGRIHVEPIAGGGSSSSSGGDGGGVSMEMDEEYLRQQGELPDMLGERMERRANRHAQQAAAQAPAVAPPAQFIPPAPRPPILVRTPGAAREAEQAREQAALVEELDRATAAHLERRRVEEERVAQQMGPASSSSSSSSAPAPAAAAAAAAFEDPAVAMERRNQEKLAIRRQNRERAQMREREGMMDGLDTEEEVRSAEPTMADVAYSTPSRPHLDAWTPNAPDRDLDRAYEELLLQGEQDVQNHRMNTPAAEAYLARVRHREMAFESENEDEGAATTQEAFTQSRASQTRAGPPSSSSSSSAVPPTPVRRPPNEPLLDSVLRSAPGGGGPASSGGGTPGVKRAQGPEQPPPPIPPASERPLYSALQARQAAIAQMSDAEREAHIEAALQSMEELGRRMGVEQGQANKARQQQELARIMVSLGMPFEDANIKFDTNSRPASRATQTLQAANRGGVFARRLRDTYNLWR
jgi:hypothetical protein